MSGSFHMLAEAIMDDDRGHVKRLLDREPALATMRAPKGSLESRISHWIYAGDTPLHVAAAGYRLESAKLLLDAGADPRASTNHRASQPLHYSADGWMDGPSWDPKRQEGMLELLLRAGADIHARDKNGATPLHRAVRTRCAGAVKFLLCHGSDATLRNKPGSTAFHLAVQNTGRGGSGSDRARAAQREIIQAFLDCGVSPRIRDARGRSVMEWAKSDWICQALTVK